MGVDLGRGDVGVAEQLLHRAQVRAAFEQVGGEGVAQDVGADALGIDAGQHGRFLQELRKPPRRQPAARAARGEEPGG